MEQLRDAVTLPLPPQTLQATVPLPPHVGQVALPAPPDFRYRVTSTQATPGSPRRIIGRVFDTQGNGLNGIKVQMSWPNPDPDTQFPETLTGRDPFKPPGYIDYPIYSRQNWTTRVVGPSSDTTPVMSSETPLVIDACSGNAWGHFSYEIVFQRRP